MISYDCLLIIIGFLLATLIFSTVFYGRITPRKEEKEIHMRTESDVLLYRTLMRKNAVEDINSVLDSFISDAADNYLALTVSFMDNKVYITEKIQKEMTDYIFGMVKRNMTDTIRNLLGLIYIIDTEEKLDELLQFRIKLYMINIMVNLNKDES